MARGRGPSRGCQLCRQRRIKCDESRPFCLQCKRTGRQCPGPIIGAIIHDISSKLRGESSIARLSSGALPSLTSLRLNKTSEVIREPLYNLQNQNPISSELSSSSDAQDLISVGCLSREASIEPVTVTGHVNCSTYQQKSSTMMSFSQISRILSPFQILPLNATFPRRALLHYCVHDMGLSLINFGRSDPMQNEWLLLIFSDPLIMHLTLFSCAIQLSSLSGNSRILGSEIAKLGSETFSLLKTRLDDPVNAISESSIATVLGLIGIGIMTWNIKDVKTHMDGLTLMLAASSKRNFSTRVLEVMFWTDLVGSALCHTQVRRYVERPRIQLYCVPIFLYPRTTISHLCRGFQRPFARSSLFNAIIDILHDLRCLTIVFYYSGCKAHVEMPLFVELCLDSKKRLEVLPVTFLSDIFHSCRLAVIIFVDFVLLKNDFRTTCVARTMKETIQEVSMAQAQRLVPELLLWIIFMGSMAAASTDLKLWFLSQFADTLILQGLNDVEMTKRILVEFFWVEDICNKHLSLLWDEIACRK